MSAKYFVVRSKSYLRAFYKLTDIEQNLILDKIKLLEENPFHPSLRSKKVHGSRGLFESSVNMDIRILWRYKNGKIILLVNVGHHDVMKKY